MPNDRITAETGLSHHEQRERAQIAALWAWRIKWLMQVSACSVSDALRATEDAMAETPKTWIEPRLFRSEWPR